MNPSDTHDRLLDAAEQLFAEHGIAATSLRAITSGASANLASVHYHFGSKEALVEAVFARRLEPLNRERCRLLDAEEAAAAGAPSIEAIVNAFVAPAMRLAYDPAGGGENFMLLIGRLYSEPGDLGYNITEQFAEVFQRFTSALGRGLPHLSRTDLLWRFFFMVGCISMPLMGRHIIPRRTGGLCDPSDIENNIRRLVAFLAAGLRAAAPNGDTT